MPWVLRGLRNGIVTTGYPKRPDLYAQGFRGAVAVSQQRRRLMPGASAVCPTGAISVDAAGVSLDRGRCILCGACVRDFPDTFHWESGSETAALARGALVVPPDVTETDEGLEQLRQALEVRVRRLRRSVHIRHVDAGSDGTEEWETQALTNRPMTFTASVSSSPQAPATPTSSW